MDREEFQKVRRSIERMFGASSEDEQIWNETMVGELFDRSSEF